MRVFLACILVFAWGQVMFATPSHIRYKTHLSEKDQEFSQKLSRQQRKIFCGQFSQSQREKAIRYVVQEAKNPDEAVIRVMEETGMPLATKRRQESKIHR